MSCVVSFPFRRRNFVVSCDGSGEVPTLVRNSLNKFAGGIFMIPVESFYFLPNCYGSIFPTHR